MIIRLLRFLRGYVTFSVKGKFPERLINLICKNGLLYWNIVPQKEGFKLSMPVNDYKKLRMILRGKNIRTRVESRQGLPFVRVKYKNRIGLPIGALLAVITVVLLSNFVWVVTVTGNNYIPTSEILKVLKDNGFYSGVYSKNVDAKMLRIKIMEDMPQIRWMSVNITGCTAEVSVKERFKEPKVTDNKSFCNIKSTRDAVITDIRVYKGTAQTKAGSAVVKGQLLISGVMTAKDGSSRLVHADGEIYGRTKYKKVFKIPKKRTVLIPTENVQKRRSCDIFWLSFPLDLQPVRYKSYKSITKKYALNINGTNLPLKVTEQNITQVNIKQDAADDYKQALRQQAALYEQFALHKKLIEEKKERFYEDKTHKYLEINYTVKEELSKTSEIIVQ